MRAALEKCMCTATGTEVHTICLQSSMPPCTTIEGRMNLCFDSGIRRRSDTSCH